MADEQTKELPKIQETYTERAHARSHQRRDRRDNRREDDANSLANWNPRTQLGRDVQAGKVSINDIFESGKVIKEAHIVDTLIPGIENEIVMIGGSPGKGGGSKRTPTKRTARMHRSGRRFKNSATVIVGNGNGYVGIGSGVGRETRRSIDKAIQDAKISIIPVRRGCGSWECGCRTNHSIPFQVEGKCGSVTVKLLPAPKGLGLAVSDPVKPILRLAGIKDAWIYTSGKTSTRQNLVKAVFAALKNLNKIKTTEKEIERTGCVIGA